MANCDRLLDIALLEQKLKDKLASIKKSSKTATWELEVNIAKNESLLAEKQARLADVKTRLVQTADLLQAVEGEGQSSQGES